MNIIKLSIENIKPYTNNAKVHTPQQIQHIKNSIEKFGANDPIGVWGDENEVVEGHGRLIALKELGYEKVDCIRLDHLTDAERRAYMLAHNQTTLETGWDFDLLEAELAGLADFDMSNFGFDLDLSEEPPEADDDDFDVEGNIPDEPTAKPGDVYQLGRHRLMCGDCTDEKQLKFLMENGKFDMMFTDPPYKMQMSGGGCFEKEIKNLKDRIKDIINFDPYVISFFPILDCGSFYICTSKDGVPDYLEIFKGFNFNILVWCKTNPTPFTSGTFLPDIEYILYFSNKNKIWNNSLKPTEIYKKYYLSSKESGRQEDGDLHPTMKPLEMIRNRIKISSNESGKVLDLFGGSGSTLIACEQTNRICHMMEVNPQYIDVIIKRWEKLTGEKAVKAS